MRRNSRACWIVASISLTVLFAAACSTARNSPAELQRKYENMGQEAPGDRCYDSPDWLPGFERCKGYPDGRFEEVTTEKEHRKLIQFLKGPRWHDRIFVSKRQRADGNPNMTTWPTHEIQAIKNPQKLRYNAVPKQGTILGRITVSSGAEADRLYGLKHEADFERTYYLVSEPYDPAASETTGLPLGDRWKISRWYLLGIQGTGNAARVIRLSKTGLVSWCGHGHDADIRADAARFLTCYGQHSVQMIKRNAPAMAALRDFARTDSSLATRPSADTTSWIIEAGKRLLSSSLVPGAPSATVTPAIRALLLPLQSLDQFSDPVWMTCGVGCCIAET